MNQILYYIFNSRTSIALLKKLSARQQLFVSRASIRYRVKNKIRLAEDHGHIRR